MTIPYRSGATITLLIGALLLVAVASCSLERDARIVAGENDQTGEAPPPPNVKTGEAAPATSFMANSFCKACHADFDEEKLVVGHARAGIGCERCHGESFRHRSDEANITPPELMYPEARINPTCMMCHPRHEIEHVDYHTPILEEAFSIFETASSGEQAKQRCTDCHAREHRMKTRNIRWDKATGELLK